MLTVTPDRPPEADQVHVWVVNVRTGAIDPLDHHRVGTTAQDLGPESKSGARALAEWTTDAEQGRASRFRRDVDRTRFLAARGALRLILGSYLARDPRTLQFTSGTWGKPALAGSELSFNLSHSAALALIAVAQRRQVGVDVERQRPIPDLEGIAARICTEQERETLERVDPAERVGAFLALWTRKEALAKMTGEGMRDMQRDVTDDTLHDCRLEQLTNLPGYVACVAAEGTDWRLVHPA